MAELSLSGVYTALVTPFSPDGSEVDFLAYEKHLEAQLEGGVAGLVPCGTTGEVPTLTDSEQRELIVRSKRIAKGRAVVLAGTGSNNTKKSIEGARAAVDAGADAVMVVMPYYSKPTQEGLFQHVSAIAKSVNVPIVLYNIPGRSAVELSVDSSLRRSRHAPTCSVSRTPPATCCTAKSCWRGQNAQFRSFPVMMR